MIDASDLCALSCELEITAYAQQGGKVGVHGKVSSYTQAKLVVVIGLPIRAEQANAILSAASSAMQRLTSPEREESRVLSLLDYCKDDQFLYAYQKFFTVA